MLGLLAHKLRAHSLEDSAHDEMSARDEVVSPADTLGSFSSGSTSTGDSPYFMMAGADLHYDQHSSEEELEVINSTPKETFRKYATGPSSRAARSNRVDRQLRPASTAPPEKRKWAQTQPEGAQCPDADRLASPFNQSLSVGENDENAAYNSACRGDLASSDEEAVRAAESLPAPVRFRTSPPLEALKPKRPHRGLPPLASLGGRACSCCATTAHHPHTHAQHLFQYDVSPRKRSRHSSRRHIQRPCLDFDKMQQLKVRTVTAWRHGGSEHGGELSVFCW